jgi:hypothetical protein
MIIEINPKYKLFGKGTCLKTKHSMIAHDKSGVTKVSDDKTGLEFFSETKTIEKNTALIFMEDKQFFCASKELHQPMSAWVRAKVITPLGDQVWVTLMCETKSIWDFKTYMGKKNHIIKEIERSFKVISVSLQNTEEHLFQQQQK